MPTDELTVIGLTCCLVGVFFLANTILFRKLRKVIEELFGVRSRSLNSIKDHTLNNIQVALGFVFLAAGFLFQIYARLGVSGQLGTLLICLSIGIVAFVAYLIGAVYSRRRFKRYLRQFFQEHPQTFDKEMVLTKEVGEFLGIPHDQETTAEDYVTKVKRALDVEEEAPPPPRGVVPGPRPLGNRSAVQGR